MADVRRLLSSCQYCYRDKLHYDELYDKKYLSPNFIDMPRSWNQRRTTVPVALNRLVSISIGRQPSSFFGAKILFTNPQYYERFKQGHI